MDKVGALFITTIIVLGGVLGGLGYHYISGGQEAYSGTTTDDTDDVPDTSTSDTSDDTGSTLPLAYDFNLPKVGGGNIKLSDLRGKVVVLDFMATWCSPCATEIGYLKEVYASYGSNKVVILSIDVDQSEDAGDLAPYISEKGISWNVLMDTSGISQVTGYQASSIPTLVIVDTTGHIAYRTVGVIVRKDLSFQPYSGSCPMFWMRRRYARVWP